MCNFDNSQDLLIMVRTTKIIRKETGYFEINTQISPRFI